ncbi:MAG: type II toxin-antitoxin system prevent-host-death family antitoxin [Planctomycetaceae bacterium]|nr:type II toxin-antitoxin system prevent-host-death family antitoxin [Planctomycetaceae bacterium]
MLARVITLTEAKAKLSELLDAVERGEEVIIVRHGERIARMRSYRVDEGDRVASTPTLAERLRLLHDMGAADRAALRRAGISHTPDEWKRIAREGLE